MRLQAAVDAVADGDVDEAILAGDGHGRLAAELGQRIEARAAAAAQDQARTSCMAILSDEGCWTETAGLPPSSPSEHGSERRPAMSPDLCAPGNLRPLTATVLERPGNWTSPRMVDTQLRV